MTIIQFRVFLEQVARVKNWLLSTVLLCACAAQASDSSALSTPVDYVQVEAALLADPEQSIRLGQLLLQQRPDLPAYQVLKIHVLAAYARALQGHLTAAYQTLETMRNASAHAFAAHQAFILHYIGNIYFLAGDMNEAGTYYFDALRLHELGNDLVAKANTAHNVGNLLRATGKNAESIEYYRQTTQIGEKLQRDDLKGDGHLGAVYAYIAQNDLKNAARQVAMARQLFRDVSPDYWGAIETSAVLTEIATREGNYWRGESLLEEALQRARQAGFKHLSLQLLTRQSEAFLHVSEYALSIKYAQMALEFAHATRNSNAVAELTLILARSQYGLQRYAEAATAYEQWRVFKSTQSAESAAQHTELLQVRYRVQQSADALKQLQQQNEVQEMRLSQGQLQRQLTIVILGGSSLLIVVVVAVVFYRREWRRQKAVHEQLREVDRLKDQVLANTSHELRTPLNGIVGLSEILLHDTVTPEQRRMLEMIVDSGRRLSGLVDDLLDFARIKQSKIQLAVQPVTLQDAVESALMLSSPLLGNKSLQLKNEIAIDCPMVMADPDRLQQILSNLLTNAIKFTEQGQIKVTAHVELQSVRITIHDQGIGIALDAQERIFEAFEQVDGGTSRRHQGVGLGLAMCKQLVELHGGQIGVHSAPAQGSRFWFTLPKAS